MSAARTGVDTARRSVLVDTADRDGVPVAYDYLVLETGVRHSYFGHDEFEKFAPGLKSLADAVGIRNRILRAFERAEAAEDPHCYCAAGFTPSAAFLMSATTASGFET
jgi:NADH dehydrogenase